MTQNHDIAAMLGRQLWTTDSFIPRYRPGQIGCWRLNSGGQLINDWGYYSQPQLLEMLPWLERTISSDGPVAGARWQTWMSLTPHEIESQEIGFRHAFGDVVVMGLGMGWVAANIALQPAVTRVTVIERDPDVIELFSLSGAGESIPSAARKKITIVRDDATTWRPQRNETVSFLYADIWRELVEPQTLVQVRQMQHNLQAQSLYFWGQEIAVARALQQISNDAQASLTEPVIKRAVSDIIRLPLLIPHDCHYGQIINQVIQNRLQRQLTVDFQLD